MPASIVALCAGLLLSGCIQDRYRYNSQHVYITPWTHLSGEDREQVLQLFSRASRQPIIAITASQVKSSFPRILITSGFNDPSEVNPWREYLLEKRPDGWHILSNGPVGQVSTSLLLSTPPNPKRPNQAMQRTPTRRAPHISDD
jgi:hypothetical protein